MDRAEKFTLQHMTEQEYQLIHFRSCEAKLSHLHSFEISVSCFVECNTSQRFPSYVSRVRLRSLTSQRFAASRVQTCAGKPHWISSPTRSEEHTSELQSHLNLVCRLLRE